MNITRLQEHYVNQYTPNKNPNNDYLSDSEENRENICLRLTQLIIKQRINCQPSPKQTIIPHASSEQSNNRIFIHFISRRKAKTA